MAPPFNYRWQPCQFLVPPSGSARSRQIRDGKTKKKKAVANVRLFSLFNAVHAYTGCDHPLASHCSHVPSCRELHALWTLASSGSPGFCLPRTSPCRPAFTSMFIGQRFTTRHGEACMASCVSYPFAHRFYLHSCMNLISPRCNHHPPPLAWPK